MCTACNHTSWQHAGDRGHCKIRSCDCPRYASAARPSPLPAAPTEEPTPRA